MEMASFAAMGLMELLIVTLFGGAAGLPAGDRDATLLNCPPKETLLYAEWSERTAGKIGAAGVDGLMADPEIVALLTQIEKSVLKTINDNVGGNNPEEAVMASELPKLIMTLIKRPGCLYVYGGDPVVSGQTEPSNDRELEMVAAIAGHFRAAIIINAGDQADAMEKSIVKMLDLIPNVEVEKLDRFFYQVLPIPKFYLHRQEDYIIAAFGEGTLDTAIKGLKGTSNGLKDSERFQAGMKSVAFERTASVSWLDVKQGIDKAKTIIGEQQSQMVDTVARMIGVHAIDSLSASTGIVDGNVRQKTMIATDGKTDGVLSLVGGRGIKQTDLTHIPVDSDFMLALSLDAPKVLQSLRQLVGVADANSLENLDQAIEEIEGALNISVQDDLFKGFGQVWTIYDSPSSGGLFFSMPVLTWEVTDKAKAQKVFDAAMKVFEAQLPGINERYSRRRGVVMEKKAFMDHMIYFVNTIGDDDFPMAPAFCLSDSHLLIGLHPQSIKSHLRMAWDRKNAKHSHAHVDKRITSFDNGDVIMVSTMNTKRLVELLYTFVPYFGQMIMSEIQREVDDLTVFSLPSAHAIMPYVSETWFVMTRNENGIATSSQSGIPFAGSAGGATLPMSLMFFTLGYSEVREMNAAPAQAIEAAPAFNAVPGFAQ